MTIPAAAVERYGYTPSPGGPFERFSTSFDQSFGLYRVNDRYYQFKSSDPDFIHLVGNQTYYASWASNTNRLVYLGHTIVASVAYPSSINIYDPEAQSSTTLLTIPYENYIVTHPLFTTDGTGITFLSTENNAADNIYDLWSIDLTTKQKVKLSDFESTGFMTNNSFAWNNSGEAVYLAGGFNIYDTDIYKFDIATKLLTSVIASKWSDKVPTISPDGNSIAFVSNRSGGDELWLYNLSDSKYSQITGESDYDFDTRYSEIQWLDNETLLVSVIEGTKHVVINMDVRQ
jgi:Tol biopolymer transport system component